MKVMVRSLVLAALLYTCVQAPPIAVHAHGNTPGDIDALIHAAATYRGASYWDMRNTLECESDHWDRRVIAGTRHGRDGEIGVAQIIPSWAPAARRYGSLGSLFESRSGDYSPSDSIYFMAYAFTHGLRLHWHCS